MIDIWWRPEVVEVEEQEEEKKEEVKMDEEDHLEVMTQYLQWGLFEWSAIPKLLKIKQNCIKTRQTKTKILKQLSSNQQQQFKL